jgi:hypothetical protein
VLSHQEENLTPTIKERLLGWNILSLQY